MEEAGDERFAFKAGGLGSSGLCEVGSRSRNRTLSEWVELLNKYETSGLDAEEFRKSEGIKVESLKKKFYKIKPGISFTRSGGKKRANVKGHGYVELRMPEIQAEYEIKVNNGRSLKLKGFYSEAQVKSLIELLELC